MDELVKNEIAKKQRDKIRSGLKELFHDYEPILVAGVRNRLKELLGESLRGEAEDQGEPWVSIDSLSSLRSAVGGRFAKLKEHWLGAGLPLKSHRGEETKDYELDEGGWVQLEAYISERGFVSRLADQDEVCIFYVRRKPS